MTSDVGVERLVSHISASDVSCQRIWAPQRVRVRVSVNVRLARRGPRALAHVHARTPDGAQRQTRACSFSLSLSFSFSLSLFLSFSLSLAPSLPRSLAPSLPRSLSLSLGAPALESGTRSPCWPTRCLLRPAGCRLPTCSRGEQSTTGTRWCGRLACPAAAPGSVALAPILPARRVSAFVGTGTAAVTTPEICDRPLKRLISHVKRRPKTRPVACVPGVVN